MKIKKNKAALSNINIRSAEQLGNAIKRFRKLQNISQIELAKKAGVTQKTISKIESDCSKTTLTTLLLVLASLELDLAVSERLKNSPNDLEGLF